MNQAHLVRQLLRSRDPSIRWRTRVGALGESPTSSTNVSLQSKIRRSARVRSMLAPQKHSSAGKAFRKIYSYWQGTHWVLASLAEIGYPAGTPELRPLVDRALQQWLRPNYLRLTNSNGRARSGGTYGVPVVRGRARRCASQQGAALLYATRLGFSDDRCVELAELLQRWQWPDGGWNCDNDPAADTSSFMETLLPLRGLAAHAKATGDPESHRAATRAAEVFLQRGMYRRRSDGGTIRPEFLELHYPLYWHYDVLGGLKGLAEVGRLSDPRAKPALDWLEARELPSGGWPADARHYRVSETFVRRGEFVDWGRGRTVLNEWVSTDALAVLRIAGRWAD